MINNNSIEAYSQKMKVKVFPIEAGKLIAILNETDAKELGVLPLDRIKIFNPKNNRHVISVVDVTKKLLDEDTIGLFKGIIEELKVKDNDSVIVSAVEHPKSLELIKKKMNGSELTASELTDIVNDIDKGMLSDIEASAFMTAVYINGYTLNETVAMTKALTSNGMRIHIEKQPLVDKHSIGGINGRATMIIVPIVAAAGLFMPKTSSRSITSAAGTADSMEVLSNVSLSAVQIKKITEDIGGVIAWGGSIDLAPVDDKIIKIEHPLSLDPEGQVIASVMAKKSSVGARFIVIDIPIGPGMKVEDKEKAKRLANNFLKVGNLLGMKVEAVLTDGLEPSGSAFGPALEAKHVMEILENKVYNNLSQKACELAGVLFDLTGKTEQGKGFKLAKKLLDSGKALNKMKEIITAQGAKALSSKEVVIDSMKKTVYSSAEGEIQRINVKSLITAARIAGAPADKKAGVLLKIDVGQKINKGQELFEIYSSNKRKLELAEKYVSKRKIVEMEQIIIERFK